MPHCPENPRSFAQLSAQLSAQYAEKSAPLFEEELAEGRVFRALDQPIPYRLADVERGDAIESIDPRGLIP